MMTVPNWRHSSCYNPSSINYLGRDWIVEFEGSFGKNLIEG